MKPLLAFLLLLLSSAVLAESGSYRVEVIVFRNLDVVSDPVLEDELKSFSHYPSLDQILVAEESFEIPNKHLPEDLSVVKQRGSRMDGVWRRLRSSQGYRPLIYKSWVQNRVDFYPPMRVHNERVIDSQLLPPTNILVADLAAEDPLAAYRSTFYQLDGSVQLKRSRFLHLFLDLEYRDEGSAELAESEFIDEPQNQLEDGGFDQRHGVFKLKENRQIRTGSLQYFDAPHFGALVLVTAISAN
jgi:hypothetical protein